MNSSQQSPASIADKKMQRIREDVQRQFDLAKATGQRFAKITTTYDDDFEHFVEAVIQVCNASSPPPHAMAPYWGESRGRDPHSTRVAGGMLITF